VKGRAIAFFLTVVIVVGTGAGYLVGYGNERTVTSVSTLITASTSTATLVSTELQTTTRTVNAATTTIWGAPIPVADVETGNVSIGGSPYVIAVNPNASRVYVAGGSNVLTVIDAVSHAVVARVTLPAGSSSGIAIDCKTGTVYVLVEGGIVVVNGTTNAVVKELPVDFGSIVFDSSTDILYGSPETNPFVSDSGFLVGVDARTGAIRANVSIGYSAEEIVVNPQLNLIYAVGCNQRGLACESTVSVVNGTSARLVNKTSLGSEYYATATIDEKTGMVYVSGEAQLVALDPYGTVVFNNYPDTCGPFIGMADDPASNQVIMATQNYNLTLVYDGWFGNLVNMYSLPGVPQYVAFNSATNETYAIVSESLLAFHGAASAGHVNDTLMGAGQTCPPV